MNKVVEPMIRKLMPPDYERSADVQSKRKDTYNEV